MISRMSIDLRGGRLGSWLDLLPPSQIFLYSDRPYDHIYIFLNLQLEI